MSDYDGGGAIETVLAAQSMFNNISNSALLRIEPWWELPLLLAAITVGVTANVWMICIEWRGR